MANEDGTVWTVFNGEIYNHHALRRTLEARGHIFKGCSDTEVLPHLYEEEGASFVAQLRGMFSLAIYDTRTRTLVLARDRFGIKPYFMQPRMTGLCSPARSTRSLIYPALITNQIGRPSMILLRSSTSQRQRHSTKAFGLFNQVNSWRLNWKPTGLLVKHERIINGRLPPILRLLAQAADQADALVAAAVQSQLESDVPLGTLLSGGIDSSLISVAAQEALGGEVHTFNVRFSEQQYDETWAAVEVAKHIGSHHETLDMDDNRGTWERVTSLLLHAGQPFADTSLFAVNAVCRTMRRRVTVALSGDGGDEGFGGYHLYWQIARIARWQTLPPIFWRSVPIVLAPLTRLGVVPHALAPAV